MPQPAIRNPLLQELDRLPVDLQQQVRELIHTLATSGGPASGGLRFAIDDPTAPRRATRAPLDVPADAPPGVALDAIRSLLSDGQMPEARRLAIEAAERFPDHARIQAARRVLDSDGKAILRPAEGNGTRAEFDWLRDPPSWARGKWVALVGEEAVASADSLRDLVENLESMDLPKRPLVHRID